MNTKLAFLFIIKISLYSLIINLEYKFFPHPSYVRRVWLRKMGANAFSETFSILSLTWIQVFSLIHQYCLQGKDTDQEVNDGSVTQTALHI